MNKDLMIGVVGAAILVTAMVGVFRYEAAQAAGLVFDVEWDVGDTDLRPTSGRTTEGDATDVAVDMDVLNVTALTFTLAWTDDLGTGDVFNLTVTGPDGQVASAEGAAGSLSVVFEDLGAVPAPTRLLADGESAALDRLESFATRNGMGTWNAVVTMVDADDQTAPVGDVTLQQDNGNEWTLTPTATRYQAVVTTS